MAKSRSKAKKPTDKGHAASPSATAAATPANGLTRWVTIVALVVVFALAAWLRFYRLGAPMAGFHVFNEGFYVNLSVADAKRGLFAWFIKPIDLNNPPLYSLIVTMLFRLFGQSVLLARLVSAISGAAAVWLVYELGRVLYGVRTGVLAAIVLALMPGAVLVSQNAQVDPLLVALVLGALVCWVHTSAEKPSLGWAIWGGLLLGLGLITKLPAVLAAPGLIAFEAVRSRGWTWLRERRTWAFVGAAAIIPAIWYLSRSVLDHGRFGATQSALANVAEWPSLATTIRVFAIEPFWMLSAVAVLLLVMGLVTMVVEPTDGDALIAVELLAFTLFMVVYHYHIYYWLPATPFMALVAGRGLDRIARASRPAFTATVVATVLVMALSSAVMLSGQKWSRWSPQSLQAVVGDRSRGVVIAVGSHVWDNSLGPAIEYYLPSWAYVGPDQKVSTATKQLLELRAMGPTESNAERVVETQIRPVIFGVAIGQVPPAVNFFENRPWAFERVGPWWQFGVVKNQVAGSYVLHDITAQVLGGQQ